MSVKIDSNIPQPSTPPAVSKTNPVKSTGQVKNVTITHSIPASEIKGKMSR